MSRTFSIACDDCKQSLWIGQGWPDRPQSLTFYYGDKKIMTKLQSFLFAHTGHSLRFIDDEGLCDTHEDLSDYGEEPMPPTDEELRELYDGIRREPGCGHSHWGFSLEFARAVLARWGQP